jgi:hypothetical protein
LAVITSDPHKQAALAAAMDGFERHFLDDFYWVIGLQSPPYASRPHDGAQLGMPTEKPIQATAGVPTR